MNVSAAILIGGQARRLDGRFKPALTVGTQTVLQRQAAAVQAAGVSRLVLIGRPRGAVTPAWPGVADAMPGAGPLGALYTALVTATAPVVIVLAGDLPFVSAALIRTLADLAPDEDAAVPFVDDRWHPLCAAYRRAAALRIKARLDRGDLRVTDALGELRVRPVAAADLQALDAGAHALWNINTPDDLARAEHYARAIS